MCRVLGVSRSGYYRWRDRPISEQAQRGERLEAQVVETFEAFKARYGAPRLAAELKAMKVPCCRNTIAKILASRAIRARNGKAFTYRQHALTMTNVADNELRRKFQVERINQKWTSDITYIWHEDRWLYLATVMDLCSRKIVGWALDSSMTIELVRIALEMALARRKPTEPVILHSDRGVQYRSREYQDFARAHGLQLSMSRKGNCWDNAPMESFYSRLKVELIHGTEYRSKNELRSSIFEYIEIFYNRQRRHSGLNYVSPEEFEQNLLVA
ncbi:transposase and inactivated derivative [Reinekea sp. MED297]|uniref:Transposase and inactivated derivative n=2 Tax=Reinekea TaxID=230494 RepID=A4BFM2_9GAMM|nr:transposase and inactivated derivative [Reinekea sp. MED297] [Reinekea blandensis MED297]